MKSLVLVIASSWMTALGVALLLPFLWPVSVLTVLMPLIMATPFVPRRSLALIIAMGAMLVGLTSAVGLLNEGGGVLPDLPDGGEFALLVGSLIAQSAQICLVVWLNSQSLRESVDQATELNDELRLSRNALARSRRRIVSSADDERSRIERDLHDGAQQQLVALGLRLRLLQARSRAVEDSEIEQTVITLIAELDAAVEGLRELAHGIYPPLLKSRGLAEALRAVTRRSPLPVGFEGHDVGRYDRSVETALYFVALEGLANVAKYAPRSNVSLSIRHVGDVLDLRVVDDGPGFDATRKVQSAGHVNMADRVAAVGGSIVVDSAPGSGTTVRASVPATRIDAVSTD